MNMKRLISHRCNRWLLALALGLPLAASAASSNPPARLKVDDRELKRDGPAPSSYAPVIRKASPSVVNIYSTKTLRMPRFQQFFDDPFFDRFFGDRRGRGGERAIEQRSLGSGVIVTEDGYILTNNHVVDGADPDGVEVALADGKQRFKAKVIGTDPQTDIALLKIEGSNLPAITLADSDKLQVGDVVFAIGNPFNVGQSVSMGIISALGRSGMGGFRTTEYEDFIQTDAAINPGNSGGALVDAEGRLVGINQSIASPVRGNTGIGFAVPINLARVVLERLVADGTVRRGYLGVLIQPITPELARAFKLPPDTRGALVGGVSPGTPAEKAGLKEGDVITEVNGRAGNDSQHIRLLIAQNLPGSKVTLKILRDGKPRTINVTLGELTPEGEVAAVEPGEDGTGAPAPRLGVELTDLTPDTRRENGVPNFVRGALIVNVQPASKAGSAGLRPGNVIQEVNRRTVESARETREAISRAPRNEPLLLRVWSRDGGLSGSRFVTIEMDGQ
jgi:serine protease Do